MKTGKTLVAALAGFVVFAPITFAWHTVLFAPFYLGPDHSVKSADAFNPAWIVAAAGLLCLAMAYFVPARLGKSGRGLGGALLGAVFASVLVDYHNFSLIGLFPGQDPASLYLMDALWAVVDGAITGLVITLVSDRLGRGAEGRTAGTAAVGA
jgi:hypothetical protein